MYKDQVFFYKPSDTAMNCLKVFNEDGDELSLSGDDSCGALKHLARLRLAIFKVTNPNKMSGDEVFHVTPDELLKNLAGFLGYSIKKL